jgi:hypothetical protein
MMEAMRLQLSAEKLVNIEENVCEVEVSNGEWLETVLSQLKKPDTIGDVECGPDFKAVLRAYQQRGVAWLYTMKSLGLGACLANDMGLGKTIQVIALLNNARIKKEEKVLLVVPASLIGNWTAEITRFAPELKYHVIHPQEGKDLMQTNNAGEGMYITTYGIAVVAAFGICSRITALILMPIFCLEMGTSVIVGQSMGAGNYDRAEKSGYLTTKASFVLMLATGLLLAAVPAQIMGIFTNNIDIIGVGIVYLRFFAVAAMFAGPAGALASVLFGSGDNVPSMISSLISVWLIQIPLLYVLVNILHLPVYWVWMTYILVYAVQFILILYFVKAGKWKNKSVLD